MGINPDQEKTMLRESQYYCRVLQVVAIHKQTEQSLDDELKTPIYSEALGDLLEASPCLVSRLFRGYTNGETELFYKAGKAIELIVKRNRTLDILSKLTSAAQHRDRTEEIAIDFNESPASQMFILAFQMHPEILTEAVSVGKNKACEAVLNSLQKPEQSLLRWRRDLIHLQGLSFSPAVLGGETVSLSTKIPEVDLKYFYPGEECMPTLSLVVKPF